MFQHVALVLRAFVRLAHRVDGLVRALFLGRYNGQQLNEKVSRVVVFRAADAESTTKLMGFKGIFIARRRIFDFIARELGRMEPTSSRVSR